MAKPHQGGFEQQEEVLPRELEQNQGGGQESIPPHGFLRSHFCTCPHHVNHTPRQPLKKARSLSSGIQTLIADYAG